MALELNFEVKKDINLLIDEKIFGFDISEVKLLPAPSTSNGNGFVQSVMLYVKYYPNGVAVLEYSYDLSAAMKIVTKMVEMGFTFKLSFYDETRKYVIFYSATEERLGEHISDNLPRSICFAALQALDIDYDYLTN